MFFTREDIEKIHQGLLRLGIKDSELPETINVNSDDTLAVVQDGKNKKINIKEFFNNISLFKKEGFINITDRFNKHSISLIDAIQTVPTHQRIDGLVITFEDINGDWRIYQFRGDAVDFFDENKWTDLYDYTNYIVKSITPDEEDLTVSKPDKNGNAIVSLKDRVYDESNFSGKGYKILRKNIQTIDGVRKNILTQDMINKSNTIYIIQYDFNLGEDITIPANCVLEFDGGSISGAQTLTGNNTGIEAGLVKIFNTDITLAGTWDVAEAYPEWFDAKGDGVTDDTVAVQNCANNSKHIILVNKYKVSTVVLKRGTTISSSGDGGLKNGKVVMSVNSRITNTIFYIDKNDENDCIIDIGEKLEDSETLSGGSNNYVVDNIVVHSDYNDKNVNLIGIHLGDKGLNHIFGINIKNINVEGRLNILIDIKMNITSYNYIDNGNGLWLNTVFFENIWGGVSKGLVKIDYSDIDNHKSELSAACGVSMVIKHVTAEFSSYAKNELFINYPSTIYIDDVSFTDRPYTNNDRSKDSAFFCINNQPFFNNRYTHIYEKNVAYSSFYISKLPNQQLFYIGTNGFNCTEDEIRKTYFPSLDNKTIIRCFYNTPTTPDNNMPQLELLSSAVSDEQYYGVKLKNRIHFQGPVAESSKFLDFYLSKKPIIGTDSKIGVLYSDIYMPSAAHLYQLSPGYSPVIGSIVFNTATNKPMWYTGEKWVYADGTDANFS